MTVPNMGLKGFKIMTDNTGRCCIEFIAITAVLLLISKLLYFPWGLLTSLYIRIKLLLLALLLAVLLYCCTADHLLVQCWEHFDHGRGDVAGLADGLFLCCCTGQAGA